MLPLDIALSTHDTADAVSQPALVDEGERIVGRRITLTLPSSLESVDRVEHTAETIAAETGMGEDACFGVSMAVREAAANAVFHGNGGDGEKQITASFENTGSALIFSIADEGKGLDPVELPDPLAPENLLRAHGRGIFLIRSFMDEVHFRKLEPGTELTLIKYFGTPETSLPDQRKA